eukprot:IDg10676t1
MRFRILQILIVASSLQIEYLGRVVSFRLIMSSAVNQVKDWKAFDVHNINHDIDVEYKVFAQYRIG